VLGALDDSVLDAFDLTSTSPESITPSLSGVLFLLID